MNLVDGSVSITEGKKLWVVLADENWGESRTNDPSWKWYGKIKYAPCIFEYSPFPDNPAGEYRTDVSPILNDIFRWNNYDGNGQKRMNYYQLSDSCFFNGDKYPNQQWLLHAHNFLEELEDLGDFLMFKTIWVGHGSTSSLTPADKTLVHRWNLVGYNNGQTVHLDYVFDKGVMYYPLVSHVQYLDTKFGYGIVHKQYVARLY